MFFTEQQSQIRLNSFNITKHSAKPFYIGFKATSEQYSLYMHPLLRFKNVFEIGIQL